MYTKSLLLTTLLTLAGTTLATNTWEDHPAAPAPPSYKQPAPATIHATFQGANPPVAQFTRSIPADGTPYYLSDPLSISHIITDGGPCTFFGVDGLVLNKPAGGLVDVGPPQTIVKAVCYPQEGYKMAKRFSA